MRCYVQPASWSNRDVVLDEEETHHLVHVLRIRTGQTVNLFDGRGMEGTAKFVSLHGNKALLEMEQAFSLPRPAVSVTLIQALPREQKMDFILQKATELGVAAIQPVLTEHALVRLTRQKASDKQERWQKILLNAAKQCRTAWLPEMKPVKTLSDFLAEHPRFDLFLLCSLSEDSQPLHKIVDEAGKKKPRTIGVLVGPEGDFSPRETRDALEAGAIPVTLGKSVLRVETAAVYVLSILRYEFSETS